MSVWGLCTIFFTVVLLKTAYAPDWKWYLWPYKENKSCLISSRGLIRTLRNPIRTLLSSTTPTEEPLGQVCSSLVLSQFWDYHFWGNVCRFWRNFWDYFGWRGFHIVPHTRINNFCFHDMAQKWLSRLLPSTPYLPYSGPFIVAKANQSQAKMQKFHFSPPTYTYTYNISAEESWGA